MPIAGERAVYRYGRCLLLCDTGNKNCAGHRLWQALSLYVNVTFIHLFLLSLSRSISLLDSVMYCLLNICFRVYVLNYQFITIIIICYWFSYLPVWSCEVVSALRCRSCVVPVFSTSSLTTSIHLFLSLLANWSYQITRPLSSFMRSVLTGLW